MTDVLSKHQPLTPEVRSSSPMRAFDRSDLVDVSSLGDALSLFLWNQPLLSDAVVQNTIASFAEVYDASGIAYNNFRGDIAALFPGLANTNGAVGVFYLDTTKLSNGLHTIAWLVTDSGNASQGIGSRYFTVQNPPQIFGPLVVRR